MSKRIVFFVQIILSLIYFGFSENAYANNYLNLSFVPFHICQKPPISPPQKLLNRSYKTYMQVGSWTIFDINGDGWCDWVRGGHEGFARDSEDPPMRDFIYLGTPKGWRHFDRAEKIEKSNKYLGIKNEKNMLSQNHNALNFFQPVAIYSRDQAKPYIATVVRYDAPAPPPNRDQIDIYQWDDQIDKLVGVSEKERDAVIDFLRDKFCIYPPGFSKRRTSISIEHGKFM